MIDDHGKEHGVCRFGKSQSIRTGKGTKYNKQETDGKVMEIDINVKNHMSLLDEKELGLLQAYRCYQA